jgi:hypothetical protein
MRTIARLDPRRIDLRLLVSLGIALVLAACNNGGTTRY